MIKRTTSVPDDSVPKNNGKLKRNASIAAAAMAAPTLSKLKAKNDEGKRSEEREREAERVIYYPSVVSWRASGGDEAKVRQHTSAYVSIRQQTSADVSRRQHTSEDVSIRQNTSEYVSIYYPSVGRRQR
jgi:hypothetical protein